RRDAGRQQATHELSPMALEVPPYLVRHVGADALDADQVLLRSVPHARDRPEFRRQQLRGGLAHRRDAERVEESPERRRLALRQPVDEVLRRLLGKALELDHLLARQSIQVARVLHPSLLDELVERRVAKTLDVQGAAAREMPQQLEPLRATEGVDAPVRDVRL